jgi:hypothetical protein
MWNLVRRALGISHGCSNQERPVDSVPQTDGGGGRHSQVRHSLNPRRDLIVGRGRYEAGRQENIDHGATAVRQLAE